MWRAGWRGTVVGLLLCLPPLVRGAEPAGPSPEWGLAWRIDAISGATLAPDVPDAAWRRSAALLDAAARLLPREPRFPRLRTLALMHVDDTDGAIAALTQYRRLAITDSVAQAQLIDLYASRLETADAKINYLKSLLGLKNIPVEVRSHVAAECAALLGQKSPDLAGAMAKQAMRLYPLPEAARQYYEWSARQAPPKEQAAALVAILDANPNERIYDPDAAGDPNGMPYTAELARLLASNGLPAASLEWYDLSIKLLINNGRTRPRGFHELLIDYASQLMIGADQASGGDAAVLRQRADTFLGQLLDQDPVDADAWFLRLALGQNSGEQVTQEQTQELARNALVRRWNAVATEIVSGPAATQPAPAPGAAAPDAATSVPDAAALPPATEPADTQPADTQPGQVQPLEAAPVIQKLKDQPNPRAQRAFEAAIGDIAWLDMYFNKDAADAKKWVDALRAVLPADSPMVQRLEGWLALAGNHPQQARQSFAKVADRDPFAAFGLIRADQAEKKTPSPDAVRKLLAEHRVGLVAAMLWESLKSSGAMPATQPSNNELLAEVRKLSPKWFAILSPRDARHIYALQGVPIQTPVGYGDPLLAQVTFENLSDHDIAVVADGIVRPDLLFDAQIGGLNRQVLRRVAFDQLSNQIVVRAHSSTAQVVRIDEGPLRQLLLQSPGTQTRVTADVITNPTGGPEGTVIPAIGGIMGNFERAFTYVGYPVAQPAGRKALDTELTSKDPIDRMRAIDLMTSFLAIASKADVDESVRKAVADFPQSIAGLRGDASAPVAAWATYQFALMNSQDQQDLIVAEMARSKDWTTRLLALLAGPSLPESRQREIAATLANDSDATVKAAAAATVELLEQAATRPSTRPTTTQPSTTQPTGETPQGPKGF